MAAIRIPIAVRLLTAFAIVLALIAWSSHQTIRSFDALGADVQAKLRDDTIPGLAQIARIGNSVAALRGDVWRHCFTRDAATMETLDRQIAGNRTLIREQMAAYEKTISRDEDRRLFSELTAAMGPLSAGDRDHPGGQPAE